MVSPASKLANGCSNSETSVAPYRKGENAEYCGLLRAAAIVRSEAKWQIS
jgi:hypothetical protein